MKKQIYYSNVTIETHYRGKTWNKPQLITGIVVSGTDEEIKKDNLLLRRIAQQLYGKAKGFKFDLSRIRIVEIDKRWIMGLGYMHQQKSKSIK